MGNESAYGCCFEAALAWTKTFVPGDENLPGVFSWAISIPLIIGLMLTPILAERFHGMYRLNVERENQRLKASL